MNEKEARLLSELTGTPILKEGDKMKVKSEVEIKRNRSSAMFTGSAGWNAGWTAPMIENFASKVVTISKVETSHKQPGRVWYKIKEDNGQWFWADEMFDWNWKGGEENDGKGTSDKPDA